MKKGERTKKAPLPFTTSTLQQEASKALNFSTQKTMRIAQQLYEGVEVKGSGTVGLITYLRTDSTRISEEADAMQRRAYIEENYGEEYVAAGACQEKDNGKKIQDAHEAIRPTDIDRTPSEIKDSLVERSVPSVSADLEAVCGKPYGSCTFMRRRPLRSMRTDIVLR